MSVSRGSAGRSPPTVAGSWPGARTALHALYPLAGGEPVALPGVGEYDLPLSWTPDGRELWVARYEETPPRIERVDVASGRARPWNRLGRAAPSGLSGQYRILVTPDGESYAYGYAAGSATCT